MIKSPMRGETPKRGLCVIAVTIPINVGARKAVARPIRPYNPNEPDYVPTRPVDDNSCVEGAIIGGILGGAATAAGSRGPDMAWSIPLGVVGGSLIGCQIDGG